MYILDEPSIGLHQRDNERLLDTLKQPARSRQHRDRGRARRGCDPRGRPRASTWARAPACTAGTSWPRARRPRSRRIPPRITGQYLTRPAPHRDAGALRTRRDPKRMLRISRRARQQPRRTSRREIPLGLHDLRHRRVRLGQIDADQRHAVPAMPPRSSTAPRRRRRALRAHRGPGAHRPGDRDRPEPDRPHAALQSGHLHRPVRADPRAVRRGARSARARLRRRALQLQRQGRPLRGLPGRRRHQGRDALSRRRLRALRRLQGQALQPRDARDPLSRARTSTKCST